MDAVEEKLKARAKEVFGAEYRILSRDDAPEYFMGCHVPMILAATISSDEREQCAVAISLSGLENDSERVDELINARVKAALQMMKNGRERKLAA